MNSQHIRRNAVILLWVALVLTLPSLLLPAASMSAPLLQGTLTPTVFVYLPDVVKQYPLPTETPGPTPTPTPTSTPGSTPASGHWTGTTGTNHPMSFDVSPDSTQWTRFTLDTTILIISPECGLVVGTFGTTTDGPGSITNNQFRYTSSTYSFIGQFTSRTTASGTFAFNNYQIRIPIPYPPYFCYGYWTESGAWTANGP